MAEVDPAIALTGEHGPVPLLEVFEGRRQLIAYFHMWYAGRPAPAQCEGCTFFNGQVRELSYLHLRDVTYATFSEGPYPESITYRDFTGLGHALVFGGGLRRRAAGRGTGSACWCVTCAMATGCSRPTGPPAGARRRRPQATGCWI